MKPRAERKLSVDQIIEELRPKVAAVPGIMVFLQNPPPITVSGQFSTSVYQMTMQSANLNEIYAWVDPLMRQDAHAARLPGCEFRPADRQPAGDGGYRSRSRRGAGPVAANRSRTRSTRAYGDRQVSTIYTPANQYAVILEVEPQYQRTPEGLSKIYLRSAQGPLVPLDAVVKLTRAVRPAERQPFRPIAGRHHFLQPEARLLAGQSGRRR